MVEIASKQCRICEIVKPTSDYHRSSRNAGGLATACKPCLREYNIRWRAGWSREQIEREQERQRISKACATYGITAEQYAELYSDHRCHACGCGPAGRWRRHHIDHDHETGAIRGLLCHHCNTALGLLGDSADRIRALLAYVERSTDEHYAGGAAGRRVAAG